MRGSRKMRASGHELRQGQRDGTAFSASGSSAALICADNPSAKYLLALQNQTDLGCAPTAFPLRRLWPSDPFP